MNTSKHARCLLIAALTATCAAAAVQPEAKPVDPGVADVGPFGMSFRRMRVDFRKPLGFDRVYELEPDSIAPARTTPAGPAKFARISGALTAVFPRSTYAVTREGQLVPTIPAGTLFVVGNPAGGSPTSNPRAAATSTTSGATYAASRQAAPNARTAANNAVDRTRPFLESAPTDRTPAIDAPASRSVVGDEQHRVARVKALLAAAADQ